MRRSQRLTLGAEQWVWSPLAAEFPDEDFQHELADIAACGRCIELALGDLAGRPTQIDTSAHRTKLGFAFRVDDKAVDQPDHRYPRRQAIADGRVTAAGIPTIKALFAQR